MTAGFEVVEPGLWTTIQDAGRPGYRAFGVPSAGAMDSCSLELANRLVLNESRAAGLEITLQGPRLRARGALVAAVCGAGFPALLDGRIVPGGWAFEWPDGADLAFGPCARGCRTYLAVAGALDARCDMGSRSTDTRSELGGLAGRPLRAGDFVTCPGGRVPWAGRTLRSKWDPAPAGEAVLRFLPGPEAELFGAAAFERFFSSVYRVSNRFDRMGLMFEEPALTGAPVDMVSSPTVFGTVQIPASGAPFLLLADGQTTGGYARLAVLASADRPLAAQLRPGDLVRPALCGLGDARLALIVQRRQIDELVPPDPDSMVAPV